MTAPVSHSRFAQALAQDPRPLAEIWLEAIAGEREWMDERAAQCLAALEHEYATASPADRRPPGSRLEALRLAFQSGACGDRAATLSCIERWTRLAEANRTGISPFAMLARLVELRDAGRELAQHFARIERLCRKRAAAQLR